MDLFNVFKDLVKETFLFRSFKRISLFLRILCIIAVVPFILAYTSILIVYGLILVIYKMLNVPADYILSFVRTEGKDVKHLTQAVIYAIGFPTAFLLKFILSFFVFSVFCTHMIASIIGYIATLAGITFSPFLFDPVDRFLPRDETKYNKVGLICFVSIAVTLFVTCAIYTLIAFSNLYYYEDFIYTETTYVYNYYLGIYEPRQVQLTQTYRYFNETLFNVGIILNSVYVLFTCIYTAIFFRKKIKTAKDEEEIKFAEITE